MTIKYGKGYEETWAIFTGLPAEVRADILEYFGMPAQDADGLTLSELVVNATSLAHAKGNIAKCLGGTVLASQADNDPWTQARGVQSVPPGHGTEPEGPDPLLAEIGATTSVASLRELYARNKDAFAEGSEVLAAYKARGRALQTAAA